MNTPVQLGRVPALVWGEPGGHVIVTVHGNLSHKADIPIELLAEAASARGIQVLSFDLPEHGGRKDEGVPCKVMEAVADLSTVLDYARAHWSRVGLFGNSIGAYFGLLACQKERLSTCLFLSPVVDMERIIENMMGWFQVTPGRLEAEREIPTPIGQTLYWDYYQYVKAHPVDRWPHPTHILYGGRDELCERGYVQRFAERFHCRLEVMEEGGHYFHTPEELAVYRAWLEESLPEQLSLNTSKGELK